MGGSRPNDGQRGEGKQEEEQKNTVMENKTRSCKIKKGVRNMTELWKIQSEGIKFEPGESICSLPTKAETDAR